MKSFLIRLFIIAILFVFLTPIAAIYAQRNRTALVIGNSAYKSSPLKNPVNDANDIAETLQKLGFNVTLKTNANQRAMENSIRSFGKNLRSGGVGLFYFAGHGLQVKGRNYLVPVGANILSEADVKYEAVDAGRVLAQMEEAGNSMNIIILDACRDNPYARSFRSSEKGLAKMDAPAGSILAYSTAPGSIAADGIGRNGLYTSYLLMNMMTPGLKIEDMFKKVRIGVSKESGKKQIPWESSSLMGDFYFSTNRGLSVKGVSAKKTPSNKVDASLVTESERLERERRELEQLKMEIERKRLEEERKRLEAEKQKIEIASHPSVSELKIHLKMNRCFNDRADEYVVKLNGETIWSNSLTEYDGIIVTKKLKHEAYKLSFFSKSGPKEKRVERTIEFTENRTININVTKNHWWCRESLNIN